MMKHYTTGYELKKGNQTISFNSEKDACHFLGVARCSVASCYRRKSKCKGYTVVRKGITSHHHTKTRLFSIWGGMKERCYRKKHPHYKDYGGRGIKICDEWLKDYSTFENWALANGYEESLTIERINVNGDYCPENCTWIPLSDQHKNTRRTHYVVVNGVKMPAQECAKRYCIPRSTVIWRDNHNRNILTGAKMDEGVKKDGTV